MAGPVSGDRGGDDGAGPHGVGKAHRRVMLGAAALFRFNEDRSLRADFARQKIMELALALARSRPARSLITVFSSCGMRAAGVPGRGENGNTWR